MPNSTSDSPRGPADLRTQFQALLHEVRTDLIKMATHVENGLTAVTAALLAGDIAAADQIISSDDDLDLACFEVEDKCVRLLALQQPVAGDLRTVITDLRLVHEIERSGDLVTNIAKAIARTAGVQLTPRIRDRLDDMRAQAERLMEMSISAYADTDAARASMVHELDDVLDDLQLEYIALVFESSEAGQMTVQHAVQMCVIGRFYERIGDHAVNIAERVQYLVTGDVPEHTGAQRARARRAALALEEEAAGPQAAPGEAPAEPAG
ncbi:MAG TPA: phosphate transport system regulatory protein PhoU [Acidimicrobiaceae bacterium]|nr:phosphate transport system regulatory protein PhoU [Acidimicrobiaceae bacterium]HCB37257.1 phosphate transport system regulatory protein PhoU [Acidimicrobiaceae bacterium]